MRSGSVQALPHPRAPGLAPLRRAWESFRGVLQHDRFAVVGLCIYLMFVLVAAAAPLIAPYDPQQTITKGDDLMANQPPGRSFILGTRTSTFLRSPGTLVFSTFFFLSSVSPASFWLFSIDAMVLFFVPPNLETDQRHTER